MSYVAHRSQPTKVQKALKYAPAAIALYFSIRHFAGIRKRESSSWSWIPSIFYAFKSKTLRNILISAFVVTYINKRIFGAQKISRTFPVFFLTIWIMIYRFRVVESPRIWYRHTYWNTHIVEKSKLAGIEYWPVAWAFNRHAQTITCFVLSALEWIWARSILYKREIIPAHDPPNELFIDWAYFADDDDDVITESTLPGQHRAEHYEEDDSNVPDSQWQTPIIVCVHGLGDNKDIPYVKRFVRMCLRNGWRVAVWSYWRLNFDESRDLHLVIKHIQSRFPCAPISAIAWSAGCYGLVRYLEKAGKDTPLVCAITQSGCFDFVQAVEDVTSNENTSYPLFLLRQVHVCIRRHIANDKFITNKDAFSRLIFEEIDPMSLFNRFSTMIPEPIASPAFDPLAKFAPAGYVGDHGTVEQRVATASHYVEPAIDHIDKIGVTTLILHAEDDPVVSSEHINWGKLESNRHIIVAHTKRGGHCAWHEGLVPFGDTWGDRVSVNFISTILESHSQTHFIVQLLKKVSTAKGDVAMTPQSMARICSASDLQSMGGGMQAPLTMRTRNSMINLSKFSK